MCDQGRRHVQAGMGQHVDQQTRESPDAIDLPKGAAPALSELPTVSSGSFEGHLELQNRGEAQSIPICEEDPVQTSVLQQMSEHSSVRSARSVRAAEGQDKRNQSRPPRAPVSLVEDLPMRPPYEQFHSPPPGYESRQPDTMSRTYSKSAHQYLREGSSGGDKNTPEAARWPRRLKDAVKDIFRKDPVDDSQYEHIEDRHWTD